MATDTAVAPVPTSTPIDPTRHVWQLPVLLLGIAVFVCAWKGWLPPPLGKVDSIPSFSGDVVKLRSAYERATPEPNELRNWLKKVAEGVEINPDQAPQARYHLGSGYVRLAEITAAQDEARGYWMLALQHFELVSDKQLRDPADGPRLAFRTAKARAAVGLPQNTPSAEIMQMRNMLAIPQVGEEAGETQRLVAELSMRLNPPDITSAKIALTQYLRDTGSATPSASLSRGRLTLGLLYIHTGDHEPARKVLSEIGGDAPAEVLAPAKAALAQVLMAEGNWVEAGKQLDLLRAAPGVPPPIRLNAAYQLGVCRLKLHEPHVAMRLFEESAKGETLESSAAAIRLADLYLRGQNRERHKSAVNLLENGLKGVNRPPEYNAALLPLNEAQAAFEQAVTVLLADGEYETALRAAAKYEVIASPGRDREKRAEVNAAWGEALQKLKSPSPRDDPRAKFQAAADEYAALVAYQPKTEGKVELLRRSAALARKAEDPNKAIERLKESLKFRDLSDQLLQAVSLELAEALLAAGKSDEVPKLLNIILANGKEPATATLYRLARAFVDSRHPEFVKTGRAFFEQIAKKQDILPNEREHHERSLTELANAYMGEGNFVDAESKLRTQLGLYPNGPEAPLARLLLGVCLLQRAVAPNVPQADATKFRLEALTYFKQIVADCDVVEKRNGKLTERESWLRLQAGLRVLQTHQQMKKPWDLLSDATPLLDRHKNTVEELIILNLVFHAYKQLNDAQRMLETRAIMKEVFEKLPPSAFTQPTGDYSREYWLKAWFPPEK
jgi:hypothetical protein